MNRQSTDQLTTRQAQTLMGRFGIPTRVQRGRVYTGDQRVPLTLAGIARLLGINPNQLKGA